MKKIVVCLLSITFFSAQCERCYGPFKGHCDYVRPDLACAEACRQCGCQRQCQVRYDEHAPLYGCEQDECSSESNDDQCQCACHQPGCGHYYWFNNMDYVPTEDNSGLWPSRRIEFMDAFMR